MLIVLDGIPTPSVNWRPCGKRCVSRATAYRQTVVVNKADAADPDTLSAIRRELPRLAGGPPPYRTGP